MAAFLDSHLARLTITEPLKHSRSYPSLPALQEQKEFTKRPSMQAEIASRKVSSTELFSKVAPYPDLRNALQKCNKSFEVLAKNSEQLSAFLTTLVKYASFSQEFVREILSGFSNPCYDTSFHIQLRDTQPGFIPKLLAIVKIFSQLETFSLERSQILDLGVTSVVNVAQTLVTLKLTDCPKLTESSFASISQLPTIQTLKVRTAAAFTDAALYKIVTSCKTLRNLSCTKCPSLTFSNLHSPHSLQKLVLGECALTRMSLVALSAAFTSLNTFKLRDCPTLQEDDFSALHLGCHVTKLELSSLSITEQRLLQVLEEVDTFATLTWLSVSNLLLTDSGFRTISFRCKKLTVLDVSHCEELTPSVFAVFPITLQSFNASNTQIDREGAKRLLLFCPKLATARLAMCEQLPYAGLHKTVTKDELEIIVKVNKTQGSVVTVPEETFQFAVDS